MKSTLFHFPLEPYKERYTEYLCASEQEHFSNHFEVKLIEPPEEKSLAVIKQGRVLDARQRPIWALKQIQFFLETVAEESPIIYFSDFFHPGLEALPYAFGDKFKAYAYCWAQTFDQYDFTRPMHRWMRPWEESAMNIYSKVFVASPLLKDFMVTVNPDWEPKIEVVGLPYDYTQNIKMLDRPFNEGTYDCVYSSRWDQEKNPGFFLDLVGNNPEVKFVVCTGSPELRGTDIGAIEHAKIMETKRPTNLTILKGLSKEDYYQVLASTKVQFNCALQDWVSFTLLEALTFNCLPLYPMFRDFTIALDGQDVYLYRPNDLESASARLMELLGQPYNSGFYTIFRGMILNHHKQSFEKIAKIICYDNS